MDRNKHQWIIFIQCQNPKDNILSTFGPSEFTNKECNHHISYRQQKQLWVGTYGQGLCRYNDETDDFTRYDHLKLPNKIINSIIPKGDLLWISTNKGLVVYNPDTKHIKTYSKSNGLYNEQFTPCSGFESSDGRLFLGSTDGFCYFFPQDLRENTYNPPVILTNMTIFGKDIQLTRPIHLFTSHRIYR